MILATINATILLFLGLLHFYWAFGGQWGFAAVLPTNEEGKRLLNPKWHDSLTVGIGLLVFGIYFLIYAELIMVSLSGWLMKYGVWVVAIIFLLRAIGDFRYLGFFKKVKSTNFANNDTRYFAPLCLWLGLTSLLLILV